jgi:DNA-binding response OmpR family regulator
MFSYKEAQMANYVLIAEDNPADQIIIKSFVEQSGYISICTDNGYSAVNLLDEFDFKLVIVDLQLPTLSGQQLLKRIRNRESMNDVPCIVLSGRNNKADILTSFKYGAKDYIIKPLTKEVFLKKIAPILDKNKQGVQDFHLKQGGDYSNLYVRTRIEALAINEYYITVESDNQIFNGQEIEFSMPMLEEIKIYKLRGRVSGVSRNGDKFRAKLEYKDLSDGERRKIDALLNRLWTTNAYSAEAA